jgi:hypothetical protein
MAKAHETWPQVDTLWRATLFANQYHRRWISGLSNWPLGAQALTARTQKPKVLEAFFERFRADYWVFIVKRGSSIVRRQSREQVMPAQPMLS